MTYACPNCALGTLKPTRITYLRRWNGQMITMPHFAAWRCDLCGYTRYDRAALAQLELIFGPDVEALMGTKRWRPRTGEGPGDRGPHRWS